MCLCCLFFSCGSCEFDFSIHEIKKISITSLKVSLKPYKGRSVKMTGVVNSQTALVKPSTNTAVKPSTRHQASGQRLHSGYFSTPQDVALH